MMFSLSFCTFLQVGKSFCREEILNGEFWPRTPAGNTVINQTCAGGKTGYKSRTCNSPDTWQPVYSYCISEELNIVVNAANVSGSLQPKTLLL